MTADPSGISRSPLLLSRETSALLVVDIQEKLLPLVRKSDWLVWNVERMLQGAALFGVTTAATEQYPRGLGSTVAPIQQHLTQLKSPVPEKVRFSCAACSDLFLPWRDQGKHQVVIVGMETHVCILQTALDLLAERFEVFVVVDAVSARSELDHQTALRRVELAGATLTTVESVLFEWCEGSDDPQFKQLSKLIQLPPPSALAE